MKVVTSFSSRPSVGFIEPRYETASPRRNKENTKGVSGSITLCPCGETPAILASSYYLPTGFLEARRTFTRTDEERKLPTLRRQGYGAM